MTTKKRTPKKEVKQVVQAEPKAELYSATISVLGKKYHSIGSTVLEAVSGLEVENAKGMAILTITHGTVSKDKILPANNVMRLFAASPLMREIALKNVCIRFQGI